MRVFLTSPWIPAEWVRAHGLEACGLWFAEHFRAAGNEATSREQPVLRLAAGVCAFAESVVRFAETHPDSAVVFTTACDQLRRGFDEAAFRGASRAFLFNLPATQTPVARQIYRAELERLGQFLLDLGGVMPTPERLHGEMLCTDETRRRLRAAAPGASARSFAESIARYHVDGTFLEPSPFTGKPGTRNQKSDGIQKPDASISGPVRDFTTPGPEPRATHSGFRTSNVHAVPLALVGGPLSAADWDLFDAIESVGGRVVLNATQTGERSLSPVFPAGADPFDALADGYLQNIADVFQRPNTRLYAWLKPRLLARYSRGIVLWHFTGCDLWRAEMQTLREFAGLPVLSLEAEESAVLSSRDINRLQAFVETLT